MWLSAGFERILCILALPCAVVLHLLFRRIHRLFQAILVRKSQPHRDCACEVRHEMRTTAGRDRCHEGDAPVPTIRSQEFYGRVDQWLGKTAALVLVLLDQRAPSCVRIIAQCKTRTHALPFWNHVPVSILFPRQNLQSILVQIGICFPYHGRVYQFAQRALRTADITFSARMRMWIIEARRHILHQTGWRLRIRLHFPHFRFTHPRDLIDMQLVEMPRMRRAIIFPRGLVLVNGIMNFQKLQRLRDFRIAQIACLFQIP